MSRTSVRSSGPRRNPSARGWAHNPSQDGRRYTPQMQSPRKAPRRSMASDGSGSSNNNGDANDGNSSSNDDGDDDDGDDDDGDDVAKHLMAAAAKRAEPQLRRKPASRNLANRRSQCSRSPDGRLRYSLSESPLWQNGIDGGAGCAAASSSPVAPVDAPVVRAASIHASAALASRRALSLHSVRAHFASASPTARPPSSSASPRDSSLLSTFTLSDFPPPPSHLHASHGLPGAPSAATPARFHFRGASFDLVNPHRSLCLLNVETPDDTDGTEYILPVSSPLAMANHAPDAQSPSVVSSDDAGSAQGSAAGIPQRFFNDFGTAYTAVTRKPSQPLQPELKPLRADNFPLPPVPAKLREQSRAPLESRDDGAEPGPHYHRLPDSQRQSPLARISDYFQRTADHADAPPARRVAGQDIVPSAAGAGDSPYGLHRALSHSNLALLDTPSRSVGDLSRESSNGAIIDAYRYNEPGPSKADAPNGSPVYRSLVSKRSKGDSTIGSIINNYEHSSPSLANPSDIRHATARALGGCPGKPPSDSLPSDPSMLRVRARDDLQSPSDTFTLAPSYTDTINVLGTPSSAAAGANLSSSRLAARTGSPNHDSETSLRVNPSGELPPIGSPSSIEYRQSVSWDDRMASDCKRFSNLSGHSGMEGSVFIVFPPSEGTPAADEANASAVYTRRMAALARNRSRDESPVAPSSPAEGVCAPIAAFSVASVAPGSARFPVTCSPRSTPSPQVAETCTADDYSDSDYGTAHADGEEDEQDWITVAESRAAPTARSIFTDDASYADTPAHSPHRAADYHHPFGLDGAARMPRGTATSRDPDLGAQLDYREGMGLAGDDRLAHPSANLYQYRRPSPLSTRHDNPFTSSPPQFADFETFAAPTDSSSESGDSPHALASSSGQDIPPYHWPRASLSVVHEAADESSNPRSPVAGQSLSTLYHINELGDEPGPAMNDDDIDLDTELDSAHAANTSASIPMTPIAGQIPDPVASRHAAEEAGGTVYASDRCISGTPMSDRNSFSKFSVLGPRGNITGTPGGTNSRFVGSSLAGSSSPAVRSTSNCRRVQYTSSSPAVHDNTSSSPLVGSDQSKPTTAYPTPRPADHSMPLADSPDTNVVTQASAHAEDMWTPSQEAVDFRNKMLEATRRSSRGAYRRSVARQTRLHPFQLGYNDSLEDLNNRRTRRNSIELSVMNHSLHSDRSLGPLLSSVNARAIGPRQWFGELPPTLHRRQQTPSSIGFPTAGTKQRLSTIVLAVLCLCPPMLIFMGHGGLDAVISIITRAKVKHFAKKQKKIALAIGYPATIILVLCPLIWLIVIKTVPNTFP